jgi:uncharacterized membrane protein YgdD (TMEM256/DUF423 family)
VNQFLTTGLALVGAILLAIGVVNTFGESDWTAGVNAAFLASGIWLFSVSLIALSRDERP